MRFSNVARRCGEALWHPERCQPVQVSQEGCGWVIFVLEVIREQ